MSEHSLQFPTFIIEKYPVRWSQFLESKEDMRTDSCYYVAVDSDNNVLGHAGFIMNQEADCFEIVGVAVKKDHQRQGVGRRLIHTICDKINDLGNNEVVLYTLGHVDNEATIAFYRNLGFEIISCERDFFTTDYDRVTMLKSFVVD